MSNDNRVEVMRLQEVVVWLSCQPDRGSLLARGLPIDQVDAVTRSWALSIPSHFTQTLSDALTAVDEAAEGCDSVAAAQSSSETDAP